jgi:hypothetical protein
MTTSLILCVCSPAVARSLFHIFVGVSASTMCFRFVVLLAQCDGLYTQCII